jgi:putative acetyltransferase
MLVRHEEPGDADAVAQVHREAFGDQGDVVAALVDDLRTLLNRESGLSLAAEDRGQVVGHVMFSRGLLDAPTRLVAVEILSPVGVRPHAQGSGIATALIRRGLEILSARQAPAVFLEGDPGFYGRLGFVPAGTRGFRKPSLRIPDAGFQVITLAAHEPWMTGTLVYPEAFWRHDLVGLRDSKTDGDDGPSPPR